MNALTDTVDSIVRKACCGLHGFVTTQEVVDRIGDTWTIPRVSPTPARVGKSLSRLGFHPWRNMQVRGWVIDMSNAESEDSE